MKIIQFTDTHLMKNDVSILNINTNLAFKNVINLAREDLNDADAIFLTGDLSNDETIESYELIAEEFRHFKKKIFWIPGNHDSIKNMHAVFDQETHFTKTDIFSTPFRDFIFFNTKIDKKNSGFFYENDLSFLKKCLNQKNNKPIALIMHHHPFHVKTPLIDQYAIENTEDFLKIIDRSKIDLIICGHVHNDYSLRYDNIAIETCPATCFQFKKGAKKLNIEHNIGYKAYYFSSTNYVTKTKIFKNKLHCK